MKSCNRTTFWNKDEAYLTVVDQERADIPVAPKKLMSMATQSPNVGGSSLPVAEPKLHRALPALRKYRKEPSPESHHSGRKDHLIASGFSAVVDLLMIWSSAAIYWSATDVLGKNQFMLLAGYSILFVFCARYNGLYRVVTPLMDTGFTVIKSALAAMAAVAAVFYFKETGSMLHPSLLVVAGCAMTSVTVWRTARILHSRRVHARDEHCINVLIIGAGKIGRELEQQLSQKGSGYRVIGFLDDHALDYPKVLGRESDLAVIARTHFVDEVVLTIPSRRNLVKRIALQARRLRLDVKVLAELYDAMAVNAPLEYLSHLPVRVLHREPIPAEGWLLKRVFDVVLSGLALVLFSPVFAIIAAAIRLNSQGPILYRSQRVGRKGRLFTFYKFRTMVANADQLKDELESWNERSDILFKLVDDPRVTRVGKVLRRYSLDEFPQFFNVLKGDMSLVGPRPPLPSEFKQYRLDHLRRLDVVPGITGLWQITCRQDPSFDNYIALDLEYIENWSLGLDFKILLRTIPAVFKGSGV